VTSPTKFSFGNVDWSKTKAWGEGGYYGRLFINKQGREPDGIVSPNTYEALRDDLIRRIESIPGPDGKPMGNRAYKPEATYRQVNGVAPDLIVIFGDLHWRSVGTIGNPSVYTFENDTGPDDANHAQQGMYIASHASLPVARRDASIYDVTPTILRMLGQSPAPEMIGRALN
jgi:predicted AlkP superfamily phosphohydrolase/phosphomutase